jgi:hypothetical protein
VSHDLFRIGILLPFSFVDPVESWELGVATLSPMRGFFDLAFGGGMGKLYGKFSVRSQQSTMPFLFYSHIGVFSSTIYPTLWLSHLR